MLLQSVTYLAPIQFFVEILKHENYSIEAFENYAKQSYRNRCEIYGANGKLALSIPINKGKTAHTKIKDATINYEDRWQKIHWKSLESSYRRSPYFEFYEHEFEAFYFTKKYTHLFDFNLELFLTLCKLIGIENKPNFTESYVKKLDESDTDYRNIDPANNKPENFKLNRYIQVFENKKGFIPNLSIVDLLFNEGPNSKAYLQSQI